MLPDLQLLEQIQQQILSFPNQRGESKRNIHYGCYLLGLKAGLRVSEAINFNLNSRKEKDLYSVKSKGQKKRFVYIPKAVISELKANNWKPNNTNRFNFYHFLKRVKWELNLPANIELTPHTLRRAFATYHAEIGLPLPLLQKLLGHKSIRTTALYWRNIYNEDDNSGDILTGKFWLDTNVRQKPSKPKPIPKNPVQISLGQLPKLFVPNPLVSEPLPNYLSKISDLEEKLDQVQTENNNLKTELIREKEQNTDLQKDLASLNQQKTNLHQAKNQAISENHQLQQNLAQANKAIEKLTQDLTNERNQKLTLENNLNQTKQTITDLNQQLQTERQTNANLSQKLTQQEQNQTNLLNTYQKVIKEKQNSEILVQQEQQNTLTQKQRVNYYENQLKSIAKSLYQWQKQNHYQKLEQQQSEIQTQIIQPPPWKSK